MRPIELAALSRPEVPYLVIRVQTKAPVHPTPTPPVPAEAFTLSCPHQMPPYSFLNPVLHVGKTPTGMPDPKIVDPTPQNRIYQFNSPPYRLRHKASKDFLELAEQSTSRLDYRVMRTPHLPCRVFLRYRSNPRKLKPSPRVRSTMRVFSVLICIKYAGNFKETCECGRNKSDKRNLSLFPQNQG